MLILPRLRLLDWALFVAKETTLAKRPKKTGQTAAGRADLPVHGTARTCGENGGQPCSCTLCTSDLSQKCFALFPTTACTVVAVYLGLCCCLAVSCIELAALAVNFNMLPEMAPNLVLD